jgi:two-component system KDP operon response regulator KdpE
VKVLLIDDDPEILDAVTVGLHFEWRDSNVLTATSGEEGLRLFFDESPDIVVLDLVIPDMNGFDILREIRRSSDVPVIILTARQKEANQVRGLDLGADDYVTKPFTILTLLARIRAILRRTDARTGGGEGRPVSFDDLTIDMRDQQVWVHGNRVQLTPSEYRLLYHLARNPNRVITNRVLCERVWGTEWHATANDLKALVHRLRAKLGDNPREPRFIENQRGMGYRFVARRESAAVPSDG